jgi:hypothetical protein
LLAATIRDVAIRSRELGASDSCVLNGSDTVTGPPTGQYVLGAVQHLRYKPRMESHGYDAQQQFLNQFQVIG